MATLSMMRSPHLNVMLFESAKQQTLVQPSDPDEAAADNLVPEGFFKACVENGHIEVADRDAHDVIADYLEIVSCWITDQADVGVLPDHRPSLLQEAEAQFSRQNYELALILWATCIEHHINASLLDRMRRQGISEASAKMLVQSLNLRLKVTALWEVIGLPPLSDDSIRDLEKVTSYRNSFVHYKWSIADDVPESERISQHEELRSSAERVLSNLDTIDHVSVWCDRKTELIEALRARLNGSRS